MAWRFLGHTEVRMFETNSAPQYSIFRMGVIHQVNNAHD
jgi:hypothetical protein